MSERKPFEWTLIRVKRRWVPEWLWRASCHHPDPTKRLPLHQPWRSVLTRDARSIDEAITWWLP